MTKATKATAKVTEAATAKVADVTETTTESVKTAATAATGIFSALATSGRAAFAGIIEVDKTLFGYAKDAVTGYVDHGKKSLQAKNINDLVDLQAAYAHANIEASVANAREIVDLSRTKTIEAYAPVKDAYASYKAA